MLFRPASPRVPRSISPRRKASVSWEEPPLVPETYANARWKKYFMNISIPPYSQHRLLFGRYLCRSWNETHPGAQSLEAFKIYFMRQPLSLAKTLSRPKSRCSGSTNVATAFCRNGARYCEQAFTRLSAATGHAGGVAPDNLCRDDARSGVTSRGDSGDDGARALQSATSTPNGWRADEHHPDPGVGDDQDR